MPEFNETWLHNGCVFCCKLPHTASADKEPGVGSNWTTYWDLWVISGTNGSHGTSGTSGTGVSGTHGTSGTSGTGVSGSDGTSGTSGTNGPPGTNGTSGTSPIFPWGTDGTFNSLRITGSQTAGTVGYVVNTYWGTAATMATDGVPLGSIYFQTGTASSSDFAGTAGYASTAGALTPGSGTSGTFALAGITSLIVSNGIITGVV